MHLDHIVIAVHDLDTAIQDYRSLGFTVIRGGVHANRATHNALVVFADGTYLELLAKTGQEPLPGMVDFSRLLDGGEGLAGFALRTGDIDAQVKRLTGKGFTLSDVIDGSRQKEDRIMRWKLAFIDDGFAPFLIQDITPRRWRIPDDPAITTHANEISGVWAVAFKAGDLARSTEKFTRLLGERLSPGKLIVLHESSNPTDEVPFAVYLKRNTSQPNEFTHDLTHGVSFWIMT